ncbi:MAG: transketolase C-terminal domain-containing protein [Rectinemataceae bacterium]|jgi:transketolase
MNASALESPREAFGQALVEMAGKYPDMVVIDPDVCTSTRTSLFRSAFPDRFFEMGIAEANSVCVAAGLAACGLTPWVSTFAVFIAARACDQVRVSVAHAALPVKLNGSYGGLPSGRGGATHSSIEDIAIMRSMPNMTILSPADAAETRAMTDLAMRVPGPVYLRTVRCELPFIFGLDCAPELGKSVELASGNDVAILSEGMMAHRALAAAAVLAREGIHARVLHFGTLKPMDRAAVAKAARDCGRIVTVENHSLSGGFGSAVCEILAEEEPCRALRLGFPDVFMESGDDDLVFAKYGLDVAGIASAARRAARSKDAAGK